MQRIHIIILNYKTYQDTITVVENLLQQENVELKIVVVDNCSPNESYNVLSKRFNSYEQVEVILSPENGGYGSGNNIGLLHIKNDSPEYVGVLNNDIQLEDSQLLYKLINTLEKDDEAYFCSPMMVVDGIKRKTAFRYPRIGFSLLTTPKLGDIFFSKCKYYPIKEGKIQKVECLPGSFFISRYNKFEQLGFFDDRTFLFEEEAILAYKIKQQ